MAKGKKYNPPKWLKHLLFIVAGLAVLVFGTYFWLQSGSGRGWVGSQIEGALAVEGGRARVGEITGNPLSTFSIHNLVLDDQEGEWLRAKEITVQWSALSLVFGNIAINSVASESITLIRLPLTPDKPDDQKGWQPPVLKIGQLDIGFETPLGTDPGEDLAGYRLTGANLDMSEKRLLVAVLLKSTGRAGDSLNLGADWQLGKTVLDFEAEISGKPGGVIEGLLGLRGAGPIEALVKGQGPIENWQGVAMFTLGSGWNFEAALTGQNETTLIAEGQITS